MNIRRANQGDCPSIALIEKNCFQNPWSEQSVKESLQSPASVFYVAESGGKIAGYIGSTVSFDECYILNVAVMPRFRGQGFGKALVNSLIEGLDNPSFITLEVRPSNAAAIALYTGMGFEKVGERKNYYTNPVENALLLTKFFT